MFVKLQNSNNDFVETVAEKYEFFFIIIMITYHSFYKKIGKDLCIFLVIYYCNFSGRG